MQNTQNVPSIYTRILFDDKSLSYAFINPLEKAITVYIALRTVMTYIGESPGVEVNRKIKPKYNHKSNLKKNKRFVFHRYIAKIWGIAFAT